MHKTTDAKEAKKHRKLDQELNKALEATFPGSDPASINQPAPHSNDKNRP